jgi:hypothetical protein
MVSAPVRIPESLFYCKVLWYHAELDLGAPKYHNSALRFENKGDHSRRFEPV